MEWLKEIIKNKPHVAISLPMLLSCASFCENLFTSLTDGKIDGNELHTLMSSADGFQTVVLFIIMIALKAKKN